MMKKLSVALISIALAIPSLALIGWIIDYEPLAALFGKIRMNPATGIGLIAASLSLLVRIRSLIIITFVIGLSAILNLIFGIPSINQILFPFALNMSPFTIICFILFLPAVYYRSPLAALAISVISFFSLIGYVYHISLLTFASRGFIPQPVNSMLTCFILSIILQLREEKYGLMKLLLGRRVGSYMAVRLIPIAILLPIIFGFIRLVGEQIGLYEAELGVALNVMFAVIALIYIIHLLALRMNKMDSIRKTAEKELQVFRHFFDVSLDFMVIAKEDKFIKVSGEFKRVLGWNQEELTNRTFYDFVHPEDIDKTIAESNRLKLNKLTFNFENRYRTKRGEWRWLQWNAKPIPEEGLIYATARDVTELKEARRLRMINQELEQFAYIVSHDLKAPLRAIANLVTWIEEDINHCLTDDTRKNMNLLKSRVNKMETLINGILQYSRIGRVNLDKEQVNLNNLVREVIDSLEIKNFKFDIGELPTIVANKVSVEQLFGNLLSNAVKHHNRDDGNVEIKCQDKEKYYEISVKDDGPGIAPEYHEKIFQPFQTLGHKENTGIGLSLCRKIVEDSGGNIWVESQAKQGANFIFSWNK